MNDSSWPSLHDAVLDRASVEWADGVVEISMRLSDGTSRTAVVVVSGFHGLRWPREEPWGPSIHVNGVQVSDSENGARRINIELQSGDVIDVSGRTIELIVREKA